jgi:prevent-host-death family protein
MTTASISETRQQLSVFLNQVKRNREDVIIQNRGEAEAVIIPFTDYDLLQEARERRRRQQVIAELKQIAQEVGARNQEMTTAEAAEISDEISREAINNLINQGKVVFEE